MSLVNTPSEDWEQTRFVNWLEERGYKYTSVPNATWTKSWNQKRRNHMLGLRPGFPDLIVIADKKFMCIEMKRKGRSTISPYQKSWIDALALAGVPVKVCYGAEDAKAFVRANVGPK